MIDEAYHQYAGESSATYSSFIDRPLADDRVIITRTFSKVYGLAGLRLGYAIAAPKTIQQLRKYVTLDGINAIAVRAGIVALQDADGLGQFVKQNENDRQEFINQAFARMLKPVDSHARSPNTTSQCTPDTAPVAHNSLLCHSTKVASKMLRLCYNC